MLDVRVFIASPGDVTDERGLARAVIEQIRSERAFRGRVNLHAVAWDQSGMGVAMEAALTPQEAIKQGLPRPSACDIVVVILWSRIGTRLPPDYLKPDGSRYLSGTEWEFLDAVDGFRENGRPSVWLYRRGQVPSPGFDDPEYEEKRRQWEAVKDFFDSLVNDDRSITGGVNSYDAPDEFRRLLEQHLRDRLTALLESAGGSEHGSESVLAGSLPEAPQWVGTPYPGLAAFIPEQAPIFFGRGRETDQLLQVLADSKVRFIAVVGASGSGKSSLVAAGLLPRLQAAALPGSERWLHLSFKPGERGDDPFLALAYPLKEALGTTGLREQDLADELGGDSEKLAQRINELLNERPSGSELLLVIDQFEELFTLVKADLRQTFLDQLTAILTIPRVRLMATLRADFYPKAMSAPALTELLRGQGTFPLSAPGVGALHEMVTRPAQIAGLELENGLVDRILDDTGAEPGALSLMAFALHRLYERDKGTGRLSLKDYTAIGGVAGAIRQRAEDTLNRLGSGAGMEKALDNVFERLIEVDEHEVATRRRAARREIGTDPLAVKLVDALIDARLLVTGKGEGNEPTVEVAHEALLSSWPRLEKWVEVHAAELRAKRDLERAAREWDEAGRPKWSGLASGDILKRYRSAPSGAGPAKSYLAACRRLQVWRSLMTGGTVTLVLLVAAFGWWLNQAGLTPKVASTVLLTRAGVFDPPPQPKMVPVPDGRFEMGSDPEVDSDTGSDEQPRHQVAVEAFYIGQYEVTFKEYDAFVRSTGRRKPNDYDWGRGSQPVIDVSWEDAVAYAKWLSLMTGKDYRLPSEAEWECAARAGTDTKYWWGDELHQDGQVWANCYNCGSQWDDKQTAPVGSFQPNAFGVYDTAGNVWEWVQDCWHASYEGSPDDGSAWEATGDGVCGQRVIRGGSWSYGPRYVRSAARNRATPVYWVNFVGCRLAQDVE